MTIYISQLFQVIFSVIWWELSCGLGNGTERLIHGDPNRIVNGQPVIGNEYPYIVSYHRGHLFQCAGSIIHPYFILTAAHCFKSDSSASGLIVLPNYRNINIPRDQEKVYKVEKVIIHEKSNRKHSYDIALLKLSEAIPFIGGIKSIKFPTFQVKPGENLTVIGWGRTERASASLTLNQVVIRRFPDADCAKRFQPFQKHMMICAGDGNRDSCEGDSGGPLILKGPDHSHDIQVGIVSFGPVNCGAYAGVYTNLYYYADWIKSKLSS